MLLIRRYTYSIYEKADRVGAELWETWRWRYRLHVSVIIMFVACSTALLTSVGAGSDGRCRTVCLTSMLGDFTRNPLVRAPSAAGKRCSHRVHRSMRTFLRTFRRGYRADAARVRRDEYRPKRVTRVS